MNLFDANKAINALAYPGGKGVVFASHVFNSAMVLALQMLSDEQRAQVVEEVQRIAVPIAEAA